MPVQGRLKLNKWEDAAGTKRTAWKITANSISKVRSTYQPAAGGGGSLDEYAPSGSAASAPSPAPWDLPAETAAAAGGEQPWQGQQGQQVLTTEQKWMDFFEDTSSESALLWTALVCCTAHRPLCRLSRACCAAAACAMLRCGSCCTAPEVGSWCCSCWCAVVVLPHLPSCAAALHALTLCSACVMCS